MKAFNLRYRITVKDRDRWVWFACELYRLQNTVNRYRVGGYPSKSLQWRWVSFERVGNVCVVELSMWFAPKEIEIVNGCERLKFQVYPDADWRLWLSKASRYQVSGPRL